MLKKIIFIVLILFQIATLHAQVAFPLTFTWTGLINNQTAFEMRVKMVDSHAALNGQKSRLHGYCLFPGSWECLRIEGSSENGQIIINLFDGDKMTQSFLFEKADKRQNKQEGEWTNGKLKQPLWLVPQDVKAIPKSQLIGFCHGVNDRIGRLQADSIAMPILKKLPIEPFLKVGEGYRLADDAFLEADYYGSTVLAFADTILIGDTLTAIHQIDWQLLPTTLDRPYILETRAQYQNGQISKLEIAVWHYLKDSWVAVNPQVFPEAYIQNKTLQLPEGVVDYLVSADRLILFLKDAKKPLVLKWDQQHGMWKPEN
jgi:hypothetical protein